MTILFVKYCTRMTKHVPFAGSKKYTGRVSIVTVTDSSPLRKKKFKILSKRRKKKSCSCSFFFFDLCNNIRFARAVFPNSGPRSTEVGRGRGRASLSFRFWLGNGLEKAASSRGDAAEAGSCRRPLECTAQRDSDASDSINHNVFFIGILMGFSVVS